ncbi:hypothetical protein [Fusobacterium ulcerans]|uniref:hypothetical protein n=1 Tax=Fusobacterium ulcerans TaxID=861 RepID=UPI00241C5340|nr:hypothetical protein [Fusobacterium ulcerans]
MTKAIINPYDLLYKVEGLLKNYFEYDIEIGFFKTENLMEKFTTNKIVVEPLSDYVESEGLSSTFQVKNMDFVYNVHLIIKSKAGDEAFKKFLSERQKILEVLYNDELIGLDTRILSQSIKTNFNTEISKKVMYDIWICTFEITAKLRNRRK